MAQSIKKNFIFNTLLGISRVIFPLITAPYVSRVLEPDGVGLFNFANTLAGYFALFGALGIPYYGIREVAKIRNDIEKQKQFVSEIISISVLATLISTIIFIAAIHFIPQLNENYTIFVIAGIVLYITPFRIDWFFSGLEEFGYITIRSLLVKTLGVVLLFVFVHDKNDLVAYVWLGVLTTVLNEVWNYLKLYKLGIHFRFTLSGGKHLKPLLVLFSSAIAISIYTVLDTLMLGFLSNYSEVGYYNCATHISKSILPIVTSLAAVVLPQVAIMKEEGRWTEINTLMNKSFSIVGFLAFPIMFGVIAIAPTFTPLFFGHQYAGAILPLQVIIVTVVAIGFSNITGIQILLGFGFDKNFLYSVLIGTMTNFIMNMMLIPKYGAVGAAIASVAAEILILIVMLRHVHQLTSIRFSCKFEIIKDAMLGAAFLVFDVVLAQLVDGWLLVATFILVCVIFYFTIQYLLGNSSEQIILKTVKQKIRHK